MFDANMRHLTKGEVFFCKIHYWENCPYNLKDGDIVRCQMLSDDSTDPLVAFLIDDNGRFIKHSDFFYDKLCTYEGNLDGTGFINNKSKEIAMSLIN